MENNKSISNENADEASGMCPSCGRHGLRVFLLRHAVISKNITDSNPSGHPIYKELAEYTENLNFKERMPDEKLKEYQYILRTIRNGYIYVMQQHGEDVNSRILQVYESIDSSLRRKESYSVPGSKPRNLPKACRHLYHSIPSTFIHLDEQKFTKAWVAYSQRAWSKETIDNYLVEQDQTVLSRFTQVDLTTFKHDQSAATNNRAVPFKDIFGLLAEDTINPPSKVLEFRFKEEKLPDFNSVETFKSRLADSKLYAYHVNDLYGLYRDDAKVTSSAIVLEDTFAIAEELNAQRTSKLSFFNEKLPVMVDDDVNDIDFDLDKQNAIYQRRAENMLAMVNTDLQRKFEYYQKPMFKKRIILQFIENYRTSLTQYYDTEIAKQQELFENYVSVNSMVDVDFKEVSDKRINELLQDKTNRLNQLDDRLDQTKLSGFKTQLESAYHVVLQYYQKYSQDYFTYVRWLFGDSQCTSQYAKDEPKNVNKVKFWTYEFDLSNKVSQIHHINDVSNMLLDMTCAEVNLAQDNALWDELLSNPTSIFYSISHLNVEGIPVNEQSFRDIKTGEMVDWKTVLDKATGFAAVYNKIQEQNSENTLNQKQLILQNNQNQLQADIDIKQSELEGIERKMVDLKDKQSANRAKYESLKTHKTALKSDIRELTTKLQSIQGELSKLTTPSTGFNLLTVDNAQRYLSDMAVKKYTNLIKNPQYQPINAKWHQLEVMYNLAKLDVHPVEINIKIRTKSIESVFAMLAEMHGGFFRQNGFNISEQAFLQQFQVIDEVTPVGQKSPVTKMCKLYLCFPDKEALSAFIAFMASTKNREILSAHDLKNFIKNDLAKYYQSTIAQHQISSELAQLNSQRAAVQNKLHEANLNKGEAARLNAIKQPIEAEVKQIEAQLSKLKDKMAQHAQIKDIRTTAKSNRLNLKVNAFVGFLTMLSVWDNIQAWGKPKEGDGEMANRDQLFVNLSSLALIGVDLTTQYRDIKLKMESLKLSRMGASTSLIERELKLNNVIGKGVARVFAGITIIDALTELNSAAKMCNMDDKYFYITRIRGAISLGSGAVLLLINNPITLAIGVILLIAGTILIGLSKKYDHFSPIEHWLNRCYFGKQEELKYLQYDAYHEDDSQSLVGFGQAINDYLLVVNGIDTFIAFKPLRDYFNEHNNQRHVHFYLRIPNFALNSNAEHLKVCIRLFDHDDYSGSKQFIDLEYAVSNKGIYRQPTFAVLDAIPAKNITEGTDYIVLSDNSPLVTYQDKQQNNIECMDIFQNNSYHKDVFTLNTEKLLNSTDELIHRGKNYVGTYQGKPLLNIKGLNIPQNDVHYEGEFTLNTKTLPGTQLVSGSELIITKTIAGTYNFKRISDYQLIIYYYNRDKVPLVITKNSKSIAD